MDLVQHCLSSSRSIAPSATKIQVVVLRIRIRLSCVNARHAFCELKANGKMFQKLHFCQAIHGALHIGHGMVMYDALYAWCKSCQPETHDWPPDMAA